MNLTDFLAIGVVGVGLKLAIDVLKAKYSTKPNTTKSLVLLLSVVVGALYTTLRDTPIFETVVAVLAASSTVYALFKSTAKK
jgi:hypothetical protein